MAYKPKIECWQLHMGIGRTVSEIPHDEIHTEFVNRILDHFKEGIKDFNAIFFIACSKARLNEVEAELINKYNPPLNKIFPKLKFKNDFEYELSSDMAG
jgi:hypothetical protein